jgi:hypothetical protein
MQLSEHDDAKSKSRVLLICGAARNDQTCARSAIG